MTLYVKLTLIKVYTKLVSKNTTTDITTVVLSLLLILIEFFLTDILRNHEKLLLFNFFHVYCLFYVSGFSNLGEMLKVYGFFTEKKTKLNSIRHVFCWLPFEMLMWTEWKSVWPAVLINISHFFLRMTNELLYKFSSPKWREMDPFVGISYSTPKLYVPWALAMFFFIIDLFLFDVTSQVPPKHLMILMQQIKASHWKTVRTILYTSFYTEFCK